MFKKKLNLAAGIIVLLIATILFYSGNPYNDIGSYLINLGKYDEAVYWLEKAIRASDYEPRHYPYFNLGRVYEKKGDWFTARKYYTDALTVNPNYELAKNALIRLTAMMN